MNALGEETRAKLFSANQQIKTFCDIETESMGSFPNVNNPNHKIVTNVFVTVNNSFVTNCIHMPFIIRELLY